MGYREEVGHAFDVEKRSILKYRRFMGQNYGDSTRKIDRFRYRRRNCIDRRFFAYPFLNRVPPPRAPSLYHETLLETVRQVFVFLCVLYLFKKCFLARYRKAMPFGNRKKKEIHFRASF